MNNLEQITKEYLNYCQYQKCLDSKTLKAYRIDLAQFISKIEQTNLEEITVPVMECYIQHLHETFQPRTAKRKIASLKALFHFLEYKDMITMNPFSKIYTKFREPIILPKTIPLYTVEQFLNAIYSAHTSATTSYQKKLHYGISLSLNYYLQPECEYLNFVIYPLNMSTCKMEPFEFTEKVPRSVVFKLEILPSSMHYEITQTNFTPIVQTDIFS